MTVCERYQISHSHFLGGPRVWTQSDRDKATWFRLHQAQVCTACGTHPDDWDPEQGGHPQAYVADVERCQGCAVLEEKQHQMENKKDKLRRGERFSLRRRKAS